MSKILLPIPNQKESMLLWVTSVGLFLLFIINLLILVPTILDVYTIDAANTGSSPINVEVVNQAIELLSTE